eukprot:347466-Pyramimonas_sp.AAC.1
MNPSFLQLPPPGRSIIFPEQSTEVQYSNMMSQGLFQARTYPQTATPRLGPRVNNPGTLRIQVYYLQEILNRGRYSDMKHLVRNRGGGGKVISTIIPE